MNDKIKEKVLNMAIHGQLVENDPTLKAVDVKEIKDSSLFDIPENWKWTELRSIVKYQNGYAFNSSEMEKNGDGIPVIKSANIGTKQVVIDSKTDFVEKPNSKMLATQIHKGDILMVLSSQSSNVSPLGVSAIYDLDTPALLNQRVLKLTCDKKINNYYLLYCINSEEFHNILSSKSAGLAQANLKLDHVLDMRVPIPPLEEQIKIVNKIEEIFDLIKEKIDNDECLLNHKSVLKQKVLNMAIHGQLVENDPTLKAVDVKEIKDSSLFDIPENWKWSNFGKMALKITDGTHKTPKYVEEGIPFLSVKDMSDGKLHFENCKYITEEEHKVLYSRCDPKRDDLLITKVGTTGVPVVVDCDDEFSLFVSVAQLRFDKEKFYNYYIKYVVESEFVQKIIEENTRGAVNKNWVIKDIMKTPIPIPPLEEQIKIVNKIEEIFDLIKEIKEQ